MFVRKLLPSRGLTSQKEQLDMKNVQILADKAAISLSILCSIHCLLVPLAVALLPTVVAVSLNDEALHLWILIAVVPISAIALTLGCKKHKRYGLLLIGGLGLSVLCAAALLGHEMLGERLEKLLTVIGAGIIALGHFWNYRLCRHQNSCDSSGCHDSEFHKNSPQ